MATQVSNSILYEDSVYVAPTLAKLRNLAPTCDLCSKANLDSYFQCENEGSVCYSCIGCFIGVHASLGKFSASTGAVPAISSIQDILNYGNYYCPAVNHYGRLLPNENIICLSCQTNNLEVSMGCSSHDLCMGCFSNLAKIDVKKLNLKPVTGNPAVVQTISKVNNKPAVEEVEDEPVFDLFS
jgi:hypothetical protein